MVLPILKFETVMTNVTTEMEKISFIPRQAGLPQVMLPLSKHNYLGKLSFKLSCGEQDSDDYTFAKVQDL